MQSKLCFLGQHDTKNNEFKLHTHNCYEIIFFVSGKGSIFIDNKTFPVTPFSYCIIPPHTEHTEILENNSKIQFIGFKFNCPKQKLESTVFYDSNKEISSFFYKIFSEYKEQEIGYETATASLLNLLLITALRNTAGESKKCKDLDYIKAYIEQYYNSKINFRELSSLSGYSYDYFRFIFKKKFGISPQTYMINIRLDRAKYLLENTSLSCTQVAFDCGFSNSAQMSLMFKQKFGISPSEIK